MINDINTTYVYIYYCDNMTKSQKIINDLYCRLACYTSVKYNTIVNTCICHPKCKLLNTYKRPDVIKKFEYPEAFNIGENNIICDCKKKCKYTLTELDFLTYKNK